MATRSDPDYGKKLITHLGTRSPVTESYRVLRTNLQFLVLDRPLKSMVVTSAAPGEGKTLTTANLAIVIAQGGDRVVVVDADLRRPALHRAFGLPNRPGLTNVLVGGAALDSALQETNIGGLQVLTSGPIPPNPAELLASRAMRDLLAELGERFDMVVVDSPPALPVTDALVLSRSVDGVLMVVTAASTPYQVVQRACDALKKVQARLLGVVLTQVRFGGPLDYYYYYYSKQPSRRKGS